MVHRKMAFHSTVDLPIKIKELEYNWEQFMTGDQNVDAMRPEIYMSWKRCQEFAVDPLQKQTQFIIAKDELTEIIENSTLYDVSKPILEDLHRHIKDTENLITLSDHQGKIIYLKGEHHVERRAEKMNFIAGADWSEKAAGSNAIGTSLASEQPIQILSFEHFCEGVHPWVCSAAPIKDPISQNVLGILDLTSHSTLAQPHTLTLVQSVSNIIEQHLFKNAYKKIHHLQYIYDEVKRKQGSVHAFVLNEGFNVVRGDSKCLSLLQISNWQDLWKGKELIQIKNTLSIDNQFEWEWDISTLQIKLSVQSIMLDAEQIGFVVYIEKPYQKRSSSTNINTLNGVLGQSKALQKLIQKANTISKTDVPVLLTGESGTGKEVFAKAIHQKSFRKNKPFIAINCGAIPDNLISSELFGYEPGAFTGGSPQGKIGKFEEAQNGTILLDEIGEMPLELQVHLLRVLQEKEIVRLGASKPIPINVRIIAATNKNLPKLIEEGLFRSDLYFRLNVVELQLPPLRKRKSDIKLLSEAFANKFAKEYQRPTPIIQQQVLDFFQRYHWPGNIRELMNVLEYAVLFNEENRITMASLPGSIMEDMNGAMDDHFSPLEEKEKEKLEQLIIETNGNLSEVARCCKIARTTLYRKLAKYGLEHMPNKE